MMGPRQEAQPALFYEFSLEDHIPQSHQLRPIGPDVRQSMATPAWCAAGNTWEAILLGTRAQGGRSFAHCHSIG
jgi:hypothetical protein